MTTIYSTPGQRLVVRRSLAASSQPAGVDDGLVRGAFRQRATHAIEHMVRSASLEALATALQAPTDFGALAAALGASAIPSAARDLDPLADALARGAGERERLAVAAGGLLSAAEAGRVLGGISRQAVDKRRRANQILAVSAGADWRYPAVQISADATLPSSLPAILKHGAVCGLSSWAMLDFLLAADETLGGQTPLWAAQRGGAHAQAVMRLLEASRTDAFG